MLNSPDHQHDDGADNELHDLLSNGPISNTYTQLEGFACLGLRTLVFGYKEITKHEFEQIQLDMQMSHTMAEQETMVILNFITK